MVGKADSVPCGNLSDRSLVWAMLAIGAFDRSGGLIIGIQQQQQQHDDDGGVGWVQQ